MAVGTKTLYEFLSDLHPAEQAVLAELVNQFGGGKGQELSPPMDPTALPRVDLSTLMDALTWFIRLSIRELKKDLEAGEREKIELAIGLVNAILFRMAVSVDPAKQAAIETAQDN